MNETYLKIIKKCQSLLRLRESPVRLQDHTLQKMKEHLEEGATSFEKYFQDEVLGKVVLSSDRWYLFFYDVQGKKSSNRTNEFFIDIVNICKKDRYCEEHANTYAIEFLACRGASPELWMPVVKGTTCNVDDSSLFLVRYMELLSENENSIRFFGVSDSGIMGAIELLLDMGADWDHAIKSELVDKTRKFTEPSSKGQTPYERLISLEKAEGGVLTELKNQITSERERSQLTETSNRVLINSVNQRKAKVL